MKTEMGASPHGSCASQIEATNTKLVDDVASARALINNFIYVYRCRAHGAANGRQVFEVPAFLTAVGTATAAAFGAGPNVAIAGGATGAILGGAKNYYSPQQKAQIFDHALDALLCIKMEAVGVEAFSGVAVSMGAAAFIGGAKGDGNELKVAIEQQYYDLVSAALFSVERVLAQRLSVAGTFDPAGVVAEIEAINKKIKDAETAKIDNANGTQPPPTLPDPTPPVRSAPAEDDGIQIMEEDGTITSIPFTSGSPDPFSLLPQSASVTEITLDLAIMRPKLERCVMRAKL